MLYTSHTVCLNSEIYILIIAKHKFHCTQWSERTTAAKNERKKCSEKCQERKRKKDMKIIWRMEQSIVVSHIYSVELLKTIFLVGLISCEFVWLVIWPGLPEKKTSNSCCINVALFRFKSCVSVFMCTTVHCSFVFWFYFIINFILHIFNLKTLNKRVCSGLMPHKKR